MSHFSLSSTIARYPRQHPYQAIKEAILGTEYTLSLVFIGPTRAQTLNQVYRNKHYIPNVLSFPLDDKAGEIYICPHVAAKEAADYQLTVDGYVGFLFIHGLLHLKGYEHGATMEQYERKFMRQFTIS